MTSERELREALAAMTLRAETAEAYLQQTENELVETQADLKFLQEQMEKMAKSGKGDDPFPNKLKPYQREAVEKLSGVDFGAVEARIMPSLRSEDDALWMELMRDLLAPRSKPPNPSVGIDPAGKAPDDLKMPVLRLAYNPIKDCLVGTVFLGGKPAVGVDLPDRASIGELAGQLAHELYKARVTSLPIPELERRLANAIAKCRIDRGRYGDYNVAL